MGSQCKPQFPLACTVACTALSSCPALAALARGARAGSGPRGQVWLGTSSRRSAGLGAAGVQAGSQDTAAFWRHLWKAKLAARGRAHAWVSLPSSKSPRLQRGQQPCCPSLFPCNSSGSRGQTECVAGDGSFLPSCSTAVAVRRAHHRSIHSAQEQFARYQTQRPGGASLQTTAAFGELGQLNCLVKYRWAGDFLKLEECGKPLRGG